MRVRELLIATMFMAACYVSSSSPPPQPPPPMQQGTQPTGSTQTEPPPQPTPTPAPPTQGPVSTGPQADGAACMDNSQCASGTCEGQGCTDQQPGVCAPKMRACTRDLRAYCGCDGATFQTSGSCPGRRYAHTGPC